MNSLLSEENEPCDATMIDEINKMKALIIAQQKIIEHISEDSKKYLEQIIEDVGQINKVGILGVDLGIKIKSVNKLLFNDKNEYYDDISHGPNNKILVGDFLFFNRDKYLGIKTIDIPNFNKLIKFAKNLIKENRLDEIQIHFSIYE